ncbi:MAG: peptide deformylase [Bacilli bacterium]|nr:peptide deformylase [Bacilli bacterium]MDD4808428.1 peptide deformylase [Bacilli bacterium]
MFKELEILDESNKILRQKSVDITEPLTKEEKKLVQRMIDQLTYSQIEEYEKKYNLRPGMGLAFPQLKILKRLIVIVHEYEEGKFHNYVMINPQIISHSEEMIAADAGEGCLSVNRDVDGHIPRYARITVEGLDENMKKYQVRAREELSIAFQHEIDHLDGILFYDRIDKKHPFFLEDEIRLI